MSGRRVQHLVVRGKSFQVRLYVPVDLQSVLDRRELRWSVRTREPSVAKSRALNASLAFHRLCDKLRLMKKLSVDDAREIARAFYQKLADSYQTPEPVHPADQDWLDHTQEQIVEEMVLDLGREISNQVYSAPVVTTARTVAGEAGYDFPSEGTEAFRAICQGIARAQVEHARYTLFRQQDLLKPYETQDELFRGGAKAASSSVLNVAEVIQGGLSLGEAIEKYVAAHASGPNAWKPKTGEEKERTFKMVQALLGANRPIKQIKTEHVRELRDFLQAVKAKAKLNESQPEKMLAKAEQDRLNPKTAAKYFGYVRALLRWLVAEGYLEAEPGATIKLATPKGGGKKAVRPFSTDELDQVFTSPLYAGFKSTNQRHLPGKMKRQDGIYWMLLLGLHTGMRSGELLQLAKSDIRLNEEIPYIDIRGDLDLKTEASVRQVPIHSNLFSYGLAGWLAARPKQAEERLFCEIKLGAAGHRTSAASKKLNGYLARIGVKKGRELVFHSFRHAFIDAARSSEVPDERIREIVGHKDTSITGGYGQGASLAALMKEMTKIEFGLAEATRTLLQGNALK
ncbi:MULTISPECIES: site-specific integrase [Maricaulis]|uniref:Phage integrase family protein n=1 Tax=Maricaulis maris (strain MCS10) TaxID=394221 RepID=Q0ATD7_MARMM|nr:MULTISPECIES: site-specific integrase [Maricaulis]ABI64450.1 phage integrase family protein [Maricaulis maris MCS10]MAC89616.1 hypothetical protein [Maricaulis sp.]